MGPLGDRLDDGLRAEVTKRCEVKRLLPGEVLVEVGAELPGMHIVGVGRIEIVDAEGERVADELAAGDFLFASEVMSHGSAPATARAGEGGALNPLCRSHDGPRASGERAATVGDLGQLAGRASRPLRIEQAWQSCESHRDQRSLNPRGVQVFVDWSFFGSTRVQVFVDWFLGDARGCNVFVDWFWGDARGCMFSLIGFWGMHEGACFR